MPIGRKRKRNNFIPLDHPNLESLLAEGRTKRVKVADEEDRRGSGKQPPHSSEKNSKRASPSRDSSRSTGATSRGTSPRDRRAPSRPTGQEVRPVGLPNDADGPRGPSEEYLSRPQIRGSCDAHPQQRPDKSGARPSVRVLDSAGSVSDVDVSRGGDFERSGNEGYEGDVSSSSSSSPPLSSTSSDPLSPVQEPTSRSGRRKTKGRRRRGWGRETGRRT